MPAPDNASDVARAIRAGEIDALVVEAGHGLQVFAVESGLALYRLFLEHMDEGAAALDGGGRILYANDRFATIIGVPRARLLGAAVHAVIAMPHPQAFDDLLGAGTARTAECVITRDGNERHIRFSVGTLPDGLRALVAADVTDQRRSEEMLQRLNLELESRVNARTGAIETAYEELDAFGSSVSHELRRPLRVIDGYAQMLFEDHRPALNAEAQRLITAIAGHAAKMKRLIDDILAYSRTAHDERATEALDMAALARRALDDLAPFGEGRRVAVAWGPLPDAFGDPLMITQVWSNLLGNALKFSGTRERAVIEIGCEPRGADHAYFVRDNGVGFDMQYAAKLFGIFQRLHGPDEFEGTGVGLAIVKRIIARHGGRVWGEGTVNAGATFYFTLPTHGGPAS